MSASGGATGDVGDDGFGDDDEILLSSLPPAEALKMLKAKAKAKKAMASMHISRDPEPEELELHELVTTQLTDTLAANFRQKALLAGKRLTDEEATQWITTGAPRIPYTPGLPESGAALRAAALALSAKAIAIQAQRLKELRAASQVN